MELEGHDGLWQVSEVGLHRTRDRLRLELEGIVETGTENKFRLGRLKVCIINYPLDKLSKF